MTMSIFKRGDRVRVTNQNSQFRNRLGTAAGRSPINPQLIDVKLDGSSRGKQSKPLLFEEGELGHSDEENPFDDYVPEKPEAEET